MKNIGTETKKTLGGINSRLKEVEDQISDLEMRQQKTPSQNNNK